MMKKVFDYLSAIIKTITKDKITVYSAYASYYVVISFVPILILVFMITGRFVSFTSEDFVHLVGSNMPKSVISFVAYIIDDVQQIESFSVISIPALTLLWTASRGVVAVTKGLDIVYKSEKERNFIRINLAAVFYTFVFMATILSSLIIIVFGEIIGDFVGELFPFAINIIDNVLSAIPIVSLLTLTIFFACLYTFFPTRKLKFLKQIPGAVFASSGWMIFSLLYSMYFDYISDKSYLYGSLTAIVLFMLWMYFCMIFVFMGGELNYYLMNERVISIDE